MLYGKVDGVNKAVSRMVYGCDWFSLKNEASKAQAFQILDDAVSVGCNAFDTAHIYCSGDSERVLGLWMEERQNREDIVILTKGAHPAQDRHHFNDFDIAAELHDSLARLRTSYVDLYLLHRDKPDESVGPIVEVLNQYHAEGKIGAFGGSNWTHQRIEEANEYAYKHNLQPFMASSPNFGLADQVEDPWGKGCVGLGGEANREARQWYLDNPAVRIFAYSSLARGFFSGRIKPDTTAEEAEQILDRAALTAYFHPVNLERLQRAESLAKEKKLSVAQIAVAYAVSHPLTIFSLQAPRSLTEMKQNELAMETQLTDAEMKWLNLEA